MLREAVPAMLNINCNTENYKKKLKDFDVMFHIYFKRDIWSRLWNYFVKKCCFDFL